MDLFCTNCQTDVVPRKGGNQLNLNILKCLCETTYEVHAPTIGHWVQIPPQYSGLGSLSIRNGEITQELRPSPVCDCGKEKWGFSHHVRNCPAEGK